MIAICRILCTALALMAALEFAQAQEARVTLAMTPAPLGTDAVAPLARPALLCGNRWAIYDYVLGANCEQVCKNLGYPSFLCQVSLVPLCQACWKQLTDCAAKPTQPGTKGAKCVACSTYYRDCMKPFLK